MTDTTTNTQLSFLEKELHFLLTELAAARVRDEKFEVKRKILSDIRETESQIRQLTLTTNWLDNGQAM